MTMAGEQQEKFNRYLKYSAIGLEMGLAAAIGLLVGMWFDGRYGSKPWGLLIGLAFGLAAGFRRLFSLASEYRKDLSGKSDE